MDKAILIFPAGMPRSLDFLNRCLHEKRKVIGASSLAHDPSRQQYPVWLNLPYVTHDSFEDALALAVRDHDIDSIYTPNPVVWDYLNRNLKRIAPDVRLLNTSPVASELERYRTAQVRAHDLFGRPLLLCENNPVKPDLTELEVTSMLSHVEVIPGMCDHEKVRALYEIARHCPTGDVVEIGSWWGKSAFVLLRLAKCFGIGKLLCVDPWSDKGLIQNDTSGLVDSVSAQVSTEEAFGVFLANLLPYSSNDVNYLRMPSTDGAALYQTRPQVETTAFGRTIYAGRIALLHIDGNHSYENANADIQAWSELVADGGWIVMDDYLWPFGDGPRRAIDEFMETNRTTISAAFFMGGALFVQKKCGENRVRNSG